MGQRTVDACLIGHPSGYILRVYSAGNWSILTSASNENPNAPFLRNRDREPSEHFVVPSNLCSGPETAFWEKLLEMFMRADATFQRVPDGAAQADLSTATSGYSEVMSLRSIGETSRLNSQSWFVSVIAVYNSYFLIARDSVSTI